MDLSALGIVIPRPGLGSFFFIFYFLISLFREKHKSIPFVHLMTPQSRFQMGPASLLGRPAGMGAWSVWVLASCSKLITWGYFPTGENVNMTPRVPPPPAAFLFMSFNSINGSSAAAARLLYFVSFKALQRNAPERSGAQGCALLPFAENMFGGVVSK